MADANLTDSIDVICIVGETRSGTTIVDRVLGTLDGVQSLCELDYFWDAGLRDDHKCSCAERFSDCAFWKAIVSGVMPDESLQRVVAPLKDKVTPSRYFLELYFGLLGTPASDALQEYRRWVGKLYQQLAAVTGQRIFIDSSKGVNVPLILGGIPGINVHVLHVVRDLRGFVYSLQKGNRNPAYDGAMAVRSPMSGAIGWSLRSVLAETLGRRFPYVRLVYDEVLRDPTAEMPKILAQLTPLKGKRLEFRPDDEIVLPLIHTIGGNPHRFRVGPTRLRVDDSWRTELPGPTRRLMTVVGYPLLKRYGFL